MVTNYPHQIASRGGSAAGEAHRADDGVGVGVLRWMPQLFRWVRQLFCELRGHDKLLQFEQRRMFLKCMSCGHESPGWEVAETPPQVTARTEPSPARVRPHLVTARRIA